MKRSVLWVVEMKCLGRWEATRGVALCRAEGRVELAKWELGQAPVRLVKYTRAEARTR